VISGLIDGLNNVFVLLVCYAAMIGIYHRFRTDRLSRNVCH